MWAVYHLQHLTITMNKDMLLAPFDHRKSDGIINFDDQVDEEMAYFVKRTQIEMNIALFFL